MFIKIINLPRRAWKRFMFYRYELLFFRHWWNDNTPIIVIASIFFLLGLAGSIPGNLYQYVPAWLNSFHINLSPELLSISFSILIIDGYGYYKKFRSNRRALYLINLRCSHLLQFLADLVDDYLIPRESRKGTDDVIELFIKKMISDKAELDPKHDRKTFLNRFIELLDYFDNELKSLLSLSFDDDLTEEIFCYISTVIWCRNSHKIELSNNAPISFGYIDRRFFHGIVDLYDTINKIGRSFQWKY